jgi:hypothetical protein
MEELSAKCQGLVVAKDGIGSAPLLVPFCSWSVAIAEDHDRDGPVREILLVADVLRGRQKDFKARFLRHSQKFAVPQPLAV